MVVLFGRGKIDVRKVRGGEPSPFQGSPHTAVLFYTLKNAGV